MATAVSGRSKPNPFVECLGPWYDEVVTGQSPLPKKSPVQSPISSHLNQDRSGTGPCFRNEAKMSNPAATQMQLSAKLKEGQAYWRM
jgi:hypothetical protein